MKYTADPQDYEKEKAAVRKKLVSMRKKKEIGLEEITLKDFIAIFAMQALLSDSDWRSDMDFNDTAVAAFSMADEMMEARNGN